MPLDLFIKGKSLHHAYCLIGDTEKILADLHKFLEKELNFSIHNNPDFWYGEYDTLDVEAGRKIKALHRNKPVLSDRKVFVINTNFITRETQNAFLKMFEEPSGNTNIFLVMPTADNLIPTLKSRLMMIEYKKAPGSTIDPEEFLKMSVGKRMSVIKKIIESISDEDKSKMEVVKFINLLLETLHSNKDFNVNKKEGLKLLEETDRVRQYATDQSPSLKMLLEHLALILPILK